MRTNFLILVVCGSLFLQPWETLASPDDRPPFPAALDGATVVQSRIADLNREGLVLGNGDLNALLWESNGTLCMRVAKNDIWDARVDTSQDAPLLKVDVPKQKWSDGGYPPSWQKPYPSPRCAAVIRIGGPRTETGSWHCIRSGGKSNEWVRHGEIGIMAIEGQAGASAGYRWNLDTTQAGLFRFLKLQISGTPGARFYVNIFGETSKQIVATGWRDTPQKEQEVSIPVPPGNKVTAVELYVLTSANYRVENRVRRIMFEGAAEPLVISPGMLASGTKSARLDLRRAVATVDHTVVRALADRNVFLIETDKDISFEEITSKLLPAAEGGETDGVNWLHMKMPGDVDFAGMEYALAVTSKGKYKVVAIVTSHETKQNVREAAMRLARETVDTNPETLIAQHESLWSRFWSTSGVQLDDRDLQLWWYRMVYLMRCQSKPGVVPGGLWTLQPTDQPGWHGDYHHNYNAWQPNWAPFIVNHPDLAEPWIRYMKDLLPRMRWFAKTTYDCEGAFVGISSFAFEPDPAKCQSVNRRQIAIPPYGYTLGMAGMSAQVLWYSHLYRPDRKYLEDTIYPVLREVALFYASFAEKCPPDATGKAVFGPSYSPEHGRFGVANVPFDLAYARFTLNAAITAATELDRDRELTARFRKVLDLLPPNPTAADETGQPVVVDWTGCKFREVKQHNITVPVVPVFPGDQVTWFSPETEKELFRNTMRHTRHNGNNSTVMFSVAKARLSMLEAIDEARDHYKPAVQLNGMFYWQAHGYYLTESVGIAAMISEFLLQSVDNTLRIFPCWPKQKDATFVNLRAQGGFLVTADLKAGQIVKLEITSTVGGKLRLLNPWTGTMVERETKPGETVEFKGH